MSILGPVPYRTAIADATGLVSRPWAEWFRDLMVRTGGTNAPDVDDQETEGIFAGASRASMQMLSTEVQALAAEGLFAQDSPASVARSADGAQEALFVEQVAALAALMTAIQDAHIQALFED